MAGFSATFVSQFGIKSVGVFSMFSGSKTWASLMLAFLSWCSIGAFSAEVRQPEDVSCAIHKSGPAISDHEIDAMISRATNARQLLANLKLALDADLFLTRRFYYEDNLTKFFGAKRVSWSKSRSDLPGVTRRLLTVDADGDLYPGMTVEILRSCSSVPKYQRAGDVVEAHVTATASVKMSVYMVPGFTVAAVRGIYGLETQKTIDKGFGEHGHTYSPQIKGSLIYEDRAKETESNSGIEKSDITFFVKLDSPEAIAAGAHRWELDGNDQIERVQILSRGR